MLTGGFLGGWTFRDATASLVETIRQKEQLEAALGDATPSLGVFAQRLSPVFRIVDEKARRKARSLSRTPDGVKHLVYAGRIIPNKGIVQLVRAFGIWPMSGCKLSLIGDYEPDFLMSQNSGNCSTFEFFFRREVFGKHSSLPVSLIQPLPQERLAEWFSAADAFLYPSFHEDEASGNAAHEAVLCGTPAIVTDWCGLGQLGRNTSPGAVATYACLGGVRFSLKALRDRIVEATGRPGNERHPHREADAEWVRRTFDPEWMRDSLQASLVELLGKPVAPPPEGGWRCQSRIDQWAKKGPASFRQALGADPDSDPEGLYADGTGFRQEWYSEARFLSAIQGFYTTHPAPPRLSPGDRLHGFWRIALWKDELALVEFGYPGPRVLRFPETEWNLLASTAYLLPNGESGFVAGDSISCRVLQKAVDLGYLVPDEFGKDPIRENDLSAMQRSSQKQP
jgi:hypothetical protein